MMNSKFNITLNFFLIKILKLNYYQKIKKKLLKIIGTTILQEDPIKLFHLKENLKIQIGVQIHNTYYHFKIVPNLKFFYRKHRKVKKK